MEPGDCVAVGGECQYGENDGTVIYEGLVHGVVRVKPRGQLNGGRGYREPRQQG